MSATHATAAVTAMAAPNARTGGKGLSARAPNPSTTAKLVALTAWPVAVKVWIVPAAALNP